jgi:AraC family transcriptional regulator, arabinose operon regulatory protein
MEGNFMTALLYDTPSYISECKNILDGQFREPLVMEKIASQLGISSCHLCHAFSAYYQISPYAYLTDLRMKEACRLLRNTHLSVQEIALSVGFSGSPHFCAKFRRHTGMTPGKYRHAGELQQEAGI